MHMNTPYLHVNAHNVLYFSLNFNKNGHILLAWFTLKALYYIMKPF